MSLSLRSPCLKFPAQTLKFREAVLFDPVFLKPSNEMDVVARGVAIAILLVASLAAAAPADGVPPAVQEFHDAMMNWDNGTGVVKDGSLPHPEVDEERPSPMPNSDGESIDGDKRSFFDDPAVIMFVAFSVIEACLMLFCLIWTMTCMCKKDTEENSIWVASFA